ncbi:transcription factor SPT20 homolog [Bactrocera dorsalis]|uniref:Transcription factor SPT20 homolog n=1 Tax=Bactrocera dorsalis TaxID=27457 RepID=A0ABM3J4W1_BACDO|nr:transcription factor SPT20 homolog [Bactrocera dorsalis]
MSCPRIVSPSLAIAVAFGCFALCLAPCCLAAAAIDTEGLTQELLVPFNDLLPPLSDAEFQEAQATSTTTTTSTTTSTTASPPVTEAPVSKTTTTRAPTKLTTPKPTKSATAQKLKKTQYQLDQQSQKQPLAVPILDLNPEVPPALPEAEAPVASQVTEAPVTPKAVVVPTTTTTQAPLTTTRAPVKVSEPKQAASTQHFQQERTAQTQFQGLEQHRQPQQQQQQYKPQPQQQQQQYKPQPQQQEQQQFAKQALRQPTAQHRFQPQVAAAITKVAPPSPSPQHSAPAATQVNVEHLRQYLEYIYYPTTRRPSRGPLPTLTPFPRHFK